MALNSPHALLPALQRHKDTVRCAALVVEVPGHRQQQLTQTLIMRLLKTHFFTPILDFKSQQKRELVTIAGTVTGDLGEPLVPEVDSGGVRFLKYVIKLFYILDVKLLKRESSAIF